MGKHLAAVHHMAGVLVRLAVGRVVDIDMSAVAVVAQLAVAAVQQVAGVLADYS